MTAEGRRITDIFYLAFVLWREARGEPYGGKVAVVHSIMNRVKNPKWWGNDVASVVTKPWQYSSMTAPGDANLVKYPTINDHAWGDCVAIATDVYDGKVPNPAPGADSYYATSIKAPDWAKPSQFVVQIGNHKFYNTDGDHPQNDNSAVA